MTTTTQSTPTEIKELTAMLEQYMGFNPSQSAKQYASTETKILFKFYETMVNKPFAPKKYAKIEHALSAIRYTMDGILRYKDLVPFGVDAITFEYQLPGYAYFALRSLGYGD